MNKILLGTLAMAINIQAFAHNDNYNKDVESIKSMTGCYKVTFRNAETFAFSKNYKYHDRFPENTIGYYRGKAIETLNIYEGILETNKYFFGDNISLSDIAIFPFIRQFSYVDIDWFNQKYKFLTNWLNLFIESDLFKSVMGKYQIWDSSLNRIIVNFKYDEKPNIK